MFKKVFIAAAATMAFASAAHADAIINPSTGYQFLSLSWSGPIGTGLYKAFDSVGSTAGNHAFITVLNNSTIDFSIADGGIAGDAFAIELDSVKLTPTTGNLGGNTRGPGATAYYSASYSDVFLSAGSHTFSFFLTDSCCNSGGASASFSATELAQASAVPEPGSLALLGLGIAAVGAFRRKNA